jgi:hypothetical protein
MRACARDVLDVDAYFRQRKDAAVVMGASIGRCISYSSRRAFLRPAREDENAESTSTREIGEFEQVLCSNSGNLTLNCGGPEGPGTTSKNVSLVPTFRCQRPSESSLDTYDFQA